MNPVLILHSTLALLACAVLAGGCASTAELAPAAEPAKTYAALPTITPAALAERLADDDRPLVVDVRSPGEFRAAHIPGAINVPYGSVAAALKGPLAWLARDRETVLHCQFGGRAKRSTGAFRAAGFTKLVRLEGDYGAWAAAGLPFETSNAKPQE